MLYWDHPFIGSDPRIDNMNEMFVIYLNFELKIGRGRGRQYPVAVTHSPVGEAQATMRFPYDELALQKRLVVVRNALLGADLGPGGQSLSPEELVVRDFGRDLFDALFTGEVRHCYEQSIEQARREDKGIRLKLCFQAPDLAALPWEFLYDPRQAEYICLSRNASLVRYLEPHRAILPLDLSPPLRVLGMIASPGGPESPDVAREKEQVEKALQSLRVRGLVELTWLESPTRHHLQEAMRHGDWHVFHFLGQGDSSRRDRVGDKSDVAPAGEEGDIRWLSAADLPRPLANHRSLRVVLLNAREGARVDQPHSGASLRDFFSSTAALLVRQGTSAVLAVPYEISDEAETRLFRVFYEALALGIPVDAAVAGARKAISSIVSNVVEWGAPVLFIGSPDGLVFRPTGGLDTVQTEITEEPLPVDVELETPAEVLEPVELETPAEVLEPEPAPVPAVPPQEAEEPAREPEPAPVPAVPSQEAEEPPRKPRPKPKILIRTPQPIEPELVLIPAGEFLMGSDPEKDQHAYEAEQPQHRVHLPDYHIARTPITNGQYTAFVEASGYEAPNHWVDGKPPDDKEDYPIVYISWYDATAYCRWLSEKKGQVYRLPSEAEWEKAARGTDGRIYPWGDVWDPDRCNSKEGGPDDVTLVDAYPDGASPHGILDMAGNVWEWTGSLYQPYPYDPKDGREDPRPGGKRVLRGGVFYSTGRRVRCAYRDSGHPDRWRGSYGFRVVLIPS
jgi:formylglycine-generating enzyme required for sulfatase activity